MNDQNSSGEKSTKKPTVAFKDLPEETQVLLRKTQIKHRVSEQYHQKHFGYTMPMLSCDFKGRRMVAVGASLVTSDDPNHDWEKPSDFLVSYLKSKLGLQWLSNQLDKIYKDRHEVAKWYTKGIPNIGKESPDLWDKP